MKKGGRGRRSTESCRATALLCAIPEPTLVGLAARRLVLQSFCVALLFPPPSHLYPCLFLHLLLTLSSPLPFLLTPPPFSEI